MYSDAVGMMGHKNYVDAVVLEVDAVLYGQSMDDHHPMKPQNSQG